MAGTLIPDGVWQLIEPLLPKHPPRPRGGRPVIADRDVLTGIIFMLKTGISWEDLPTEMGCGCGMTCLRRLRDWQRAGVWLQIQEILQTHLREARRMDWSRVRARLLPRLTFPLHAGRTDDMDDSIQPADSMLPPADDLTEDSPQRLTVTQQ